MPKPLPTFRSHLTLGLCTILHGFTHAYGTMLVPLYFRMKDDLHLSSLSSATLVVTLYGAVYNLGSYAGGILSDRYSRKKLLAIGLFGNAVAIAGIGLSRQYWLILAWGIVAGLCGTIYHPTANAMAPSHYPRTPGMAIGLLAMGSGLGYFFGPQIAGWRADTAAWHFASVAQWQKPCVEMGIAGIVVGIIFLLLAADPEPVPVHHQGGMVPDDSCENSPPPLVLRGRDGVGVECAMPDDNPHPRPSPEYQGRGEEGLHHVSRTQAPVMPAGLKKQVAGIALVLMFRDFAGVAGISLAAIYVKNVFGMGVAAAGLFVGIMMLPSVLTNPLGVYLTMGRRRLGGLATVLVVGGLLVVTTPLWPMGMALVILCAFQTMQLVSYAIGDAAVLERVAPQVRGRVVGVFLVIAGSFGALGPWVMGAWVDRLHRAELPSAYFAPFALLGAMMIAASLAPRLIARLGPVAGDAPITPAEEISPATLGP